MRVLMVAQSIYGDGIGTVVSNMQASLTNVGVVVDVAVFQNYSIDNTAVKEVLDNGGNIFHIPGLKQAGFFGFMKKIKQLCQENYYDVIHIHTGMFAWIAAKAAKSCNIKKRIGHAHGKMTNMPFVLEKALMGPFRLMNQRYCTDLVGCTEESNRFAFGKKGIVIPNYVRTERILGVPQDTIKDTRLKLDGNNDKVLFCFMGNVDVNKNVIFLPEVLKELRERNINAELIVIGEGIMLDKTKALARTMNVDKNIVFLGRRNDCNVLIQAMDYYISASFSEGMSMSMIEAQMSGKPCFVSNTISKDSDLGIGLFHYVEKYDAKIWADTIEKVVKNQKCAISREMVLQKIDEASLSEEKIVKKLLSIYREYH